MAVTLLIQVTRFGYLTYPKIDREQTWNFSLILSIFDFKCKILDQNATINDRDFINTSVKVQIVKNGKYPTYPKIDRQQTWNFPSVLSIFNFKYKIINQNVVINGSDVIDTSDKVWIVQNGKYLTYPKIDCEQTWNFSLILSIFDFECKILDQNATINDSNIINTSVKIQIVKNHKYLTYPKIDREQTWNFPSVLSIFNFKCKTIYQNVVINGSDVIDTSDKVWIVQNGKYLTYPKIDCEQTWNFSLIMSIFDFECKILDQNATINGRDIINTIVKVQIVKNGKYFTYPKIDREQTWNFPTVLSIFDFKCKIINQNVVINGSDIIDTSDKVWIVQNGKYLTYPKIDREQTWNFSLILSIFDFKCKILNQNATINGREIINTSVKVQIVKNGKYLTYPTIDCKQTCNFPSVLLIFDFKCKIIYQNVVINGSDVIDTSDKVWIVQNGKYLTYPKIDREQTWNFSLILSIFDFKCKTLDQNATINGREIINTCVKVQIVKNGKYLTYPKTDREQTWNFPSVLSIFNFKYKIINQNVVINGSDVIDTSDKVWIVQNGKYLTYPKIDREQTWNFSLILSIYDFKCKILDQNATINGREIINTSVKVQIVKNGKYLAYPKIDCKQTWNFPSVLSIFDFKCKIINQNAVTNGSDVIDTSDKVWIVQNGKYLTYPKIDREQTWNFSLILSIFDFKCKILNQNATINGREIINTSVKVQIVKNGKYLTYPKIDCKQTWNFPSVLSIFDFKCKVINQNVVINGSDVIDTSDMVWIVQNGKYLTYPKIDREQTWNFSLILSIFDFKCKTLDQNATINGREIINTYVKVQIVKNGKYLTYPKIDRQQTWNFPSVLSIFDFKYKIINQNVVINGSDVIDTSDKVWIVQNGKYLTYPKIDREQTWNFSLILSIYDFKCKILDQNATINGRDIINTSVKVQIVKNGKYLTYPKIDCKQTWNFPSVLSIFDFKCKIINQNVVTNGSDVIDKSEKVWIVQNGKYLTYPKIDREQTWNFSLILSIF